MNRRLLCVGVSLLPLIVVTFLKWPSGPPFQVGDPFHYLLHARAVVEGRAYTDTGYIFSSMNPWHGPRVQPPGLPLTLVPLFILTGGADIAIQISMFLFALAFLGAAGWYFAGQQGLALGAAVAMTTGFADGFFERLTFAHSDLPFAFLFWLIIILVELKDRPGPWRLAAVTVLGILAVAYRIVAVAVGPALLVYTFLAFEQRKRWLIPIGLWATIGVVGFLSSSLTLASFGPSLADPLGYLPSAPRHLWEYRYPLLSGFLYPLPWNVANDVYHALALPLVGLGLAAWVRSNPRSFGLWFGATYLALLVALPITPGSRYVWPLFPMIMYCLFRGVSAGVRYLAPDFRQRAVVSTTAVLVGVTVITTLSQETKPAMTSYPGGRRGDRLSSNHQRTADSNGVAHAAGLYVVHADSWHADPDLPGRGTHRVGARESRNQSRDYYQY